MLKLPFPVMYCSRQCQKGLAPRHKQYHARLESSLQSLQRHARCWRKLAIGFKAAAADKPNIPPLAAAAEKKADAEAPKIITRAEEIDQRPTLLDVTGACPVTTYELLKHRLPPHSCDRTRDPHADRTDVGRCGLAPPYGWTVTRMSMHVPRGMQRSPPPWTSTGGPEGVCMIMAGVGQLDYGLGWVGVDGGARWGIGAIVLHFQMRSFLVLTCTPAPIKQAGNPAFFAFSGAYRRHHKPPLRGGQLRLRAGSRVR